MVHKMSKENKSGNLHVEQLVPKQNQPSLTRRESALNYPAKPTGEQGRDPRSRPPAPRPPSSGEPPVRPEPHLAGESEGAHPAARRTRTPRRGARDPPLSRQRPEAAASPPAARGLTPARVSLTGRSPAFPA